MTFLCKQQTKPGDGTLETKTDYIEVTLSTSTEQVNIENSLQVFPNPTDGRVNVKMDLKGGENVQFELMDITGRQIGFLGNTVGVSGTDIFAFDISQYAKSNQIVVLRITVDGESFTRMIKVNK